MSSSSSRHSGTTMLTSSRSQDRDRHSRMDWMVKSPLCPRAEHLHVPCGDGGLATCNWNRITCPLSRSRCGSWPNSCELVTNPMIGLALLGSLLNLLAILRLRRLRIRPASQWRQKPVGIERVRMERLQLVLSLAALRSLCFRSTFIWTIFILCDRSPITSRTIFGVVSSVSLRRTAP